MYKFSVSFLFFILIQFTVQAQKYRTAAGIRIGRNDVGVTAQQKILQNTTIEGIGTFGSREVSLTGLVEQHFPIIGKGFNVYLGAGAHVGSLKDHGGFYGGDLLAGAEMKLPIVPLVISLDLKPAFHVNHEDWGSLGGGFSIRYILLKEKKEKKKLFGIFGGGNDEKTKRKRNKDKDKKSGGWFDFLNKDEE